MPNIALKLLNGIYGWILGTVIMTTAIYSVYSIWDNSQVYQAAENVQNEIRKLKPIVVEGDDGEQGPGFDELQKVNEDVVGWITVNNTNIDYPILQGDTNLTYMDKDVYGEFSMAGSIFLDIRNKADFSDNYSLVYGHNMDEHLMFGDIALFKDIDFFRENTAAELILPGEIRDMSVVAVMQISAGTEQIFNPNMWKESMSGLAEFIEKYSIYYHSNWTDKLKENPDKYQIVTLVTCSSGSTNDRSVLILIREKEKVDPPEDDPPKDEPSEEETTPEETSPEETSAEETSPEETSAEETSPEETSAEETSPEETSAQETSENETKPPKTEGDGDDIHQGEADPSGDSSNINFWMYMTIGSFLFIVLVEIVDRKKKAL